MPKTLDLVVVSMIFVIINTVWKSLMSNALSWNIKANYCWKQSIAITSKSSIS